MPFFGVKPKVMTQDQFFGAATKGGGHYHKVDTSMSDMIGGDEYAIAPRHQSGRKVHTVKKDRGFFVMAIAIEVFEKLDPTSRLAISIQAERIINHFNNP